MKKLEIGKIVEKLKEGAKEAKAAKKAGTVPTPQIKPATKSYRERDMRQEAKDMGSYGSSEYFADPGISEQ